MASITGTEIVGMVRHWLSTPIGGYLGSDYGSDTKALLQNPHNVVLADKFLAKLRRDVPVLAALPSSSVNLYASPSGIDRMDIVLEVAGVAIILGG